MSILDRTDLRLTRWFLVAVAVVAPLFLTVFPIVRWSLGAALTWSGDAGDGRGLEPLLTAADGARLSWDGEAQVRIADASPGLWAATLGCQVLLAAAVVAVALMLRHVVGEIQVGHPFTRSSLRALRATGLVIVAAAVVLPFATGLATAAVMERAVADRPLSLTISFDPLWLLGGVLVLALAEAFRVGARLADDVDGLV